MFSFYNKIPTGFDLRLDYIGCLEKEIELEFRATPDLNPPSDLLMHQIASDFVKNLMTYAISAWSPFATQTMCEHIEEYSAISVKCHTVNSSLKRVIFDT